MEILLIIPEMQSWKAEKQPMQFTLSDYQDMLMNAPIGIFSSRPDGRILFANSTLARIFGYDSPQELIDSIEDIGAQLYADPKDREKIKRSLEKNAEKLNYECRFVRRDNSMFWASYNVRAVRDKKGNIAYYQGFFADITERKKERESLMKTQFAMDRAPDSILWVDDKGFIVYANDSACTSMGYTRDELLKVKVFDIDPDFPLDNWEQHKDEVRRRGTMTFESRHRTKDGRFFPVEVKTNHFKFNDLYLACAFDRDISERKKAEQEREKLIEQLNRVRNLESIATLAGGIAHDFNNLLMGIQGHVSLMKFNLDSSHPYYDRLKQIEKQIRIGADLTAQLLGFARSGPYDLKATDINEIVQKTSIMFRRTKKKITIRKKFKKDLWTVEVDRTQMELVFMNLFTNARHAMPEGGELFLETDNFHVEDGSMHSLAPGKYVKISVSDTGIGMDAQTCERIFDPFFTTKTMGRGTGLGLSAVYGIIKGHGGMIDVTSKPGQGTTFTIYLPTREKTVLSENAVATQILKGTETILLVDDEAIVQDVARQMLQALGYRVYCVVNGQEAVTVYNGKKNEIDLVILDMIMPGMSGSETFDRLREIDSSQKVLLSSGYSIDGKAREILEKGCNGFLQKPFQMKELALKIRSILDMKEELTMTASRADMPNPTIGVY